MSNRVFWVVKNNRGEYLGWDWNFSSDKKNRVEYEDRVSAENIADDMLLADFYKKVVKVTVKKKPKYVSKNDAELNKEIITKIYHAAFPSGKWYQNLTYADMLDMYDNITMILKEYGLAPLDAYKYKI